MAKKLPIRTKRPLGGVRVGKARSEKGAQAKAVRYIKPGHRAIVGTKDSQGLLYEIYVF